MNKQDLFEKCECSYDENDFKKDLKFEMNDKREIKREIVDYLCGSADELSEKFLNLLRSYGMGEVEGLLIKNELLSHVDSKSDINLIFESEFWDYYNISHELEDDLDIKLIKDYRGDDFRDHLSGEYVENNFSYSEFKKYTEDEEYWRLVKRQYPQSLSEAVDAAIDMLDIEDVTSIRDHEKSAFRIHAHFALGLFMRNNFGINNGRASGLLEDFRNNSKMRFYQSDDISGFLCERIWDEIQENHDEIIAAKSKNEDISTPKLERECESCYRDEEYGKVIEASDKLLKSNPQNHTALSYKIMSCYYLEDYATALDTAESALEIYPDYSRFLNLKAHVLHASGKETLAMECLDNGDDINFLNRKLLFLIETGKLDEAYDFFSSLDSEVLLSGFKIQVLARNLAKAGKCDKAIECYNFVLKKLIKPYTNRLEFHFRDIMILDRIKADFIDYNLDLNRIYFNDLYISWIDKLAFKKPTESCPVCGGKLTPIVYRNLDFYDASESKNDEIIRESTLSEFHPYTDIREYYCPGCKREFDMGIRGIYFEKTDNYLQEKYGLGKIHEFHCPVYKGKVSRDALERDLFYFDEDELDAFIAKLISIEYIVEKEKDSYEIKNFSGIE
jgi:tetratricopeptide (TPR) repeat protein